MGRLSLNISARGMGKLLSLAIRSGDKLGFRINGDKRTAEDLASKLKKVIC